MILRVHLGTTKAAMRSKKGGGMNQRTCKLCGGVNGAIRDKKHVHPIECAQHAQDCYRAMSEHFETCPRCIDAGGADGLVTDLCAAGRVLVAEYDRADNGATVAMREMKEGVCTR